MMPCSIKISPLKMLRSIGYAIFPFILFIELFRNFCFTFPQDTHPVSMKLRWPRIQVFCKPAESLLLIEYNMGVVFSIVPLLKLLRGLQHDGHDPKITIRPQEAPEQIKLLPGIEKVFGCFGNSYKIIPLRQALRFVCIKRVVDSYRVASLFKHQVQCRAGPRSVIQPVTFFRQKSNKRAKELTEEMTVVWIFWMVFVLVIAGPLHRRL